MTDSPFFNLYRHGYVRVAVGVPSLRVADPEFNAEQTVAVLRRAAERKVLVAVMPELGLSAYSCDDLFHQQALLDGCLRGLRHVLDASRELPLIAAVGLPLQVDGLLFNCAALLSRGKVLGVVPKTYLPNYREFYEARYFAPADRARRDRVELCGQEAPFGSRLLFRLKEQPHLTMHLELCEDVWVPIPPSSYAAMAGATLLANLSASNITVGKGDYRRQLVANQSARCVAAYLYAAAGYGESTTDLAWDGHGMICENGSLLAETARFRHEPQLATADVDLDRLVQDRMRQNTFGQSVEQHAAALEPFRTVEISLELPRGELLLERSCERFPYVPSDPARRSERCEEIYAIQVQGLVKRLSALGADKVVIGISGGLDSTHALLVCAKAMDVMGLPRANILAYTMPGFATSGRTLGQARRLMAGVGATAQEIDIRPACMEMMKAIGHPFASEQPVFDVTFENVQAGERTNHLFRLANLHRAPVVGTSDLSELALGWCTYGVGDHMAHYHVNASVPKTLIKHLIRWVADTGQLGDGELRPVLLDVLDTAISPELVPGEHEGQPTQRTEDTIGPYELQDFNLYYTLRFGYAPSKIAFLSWCTWRDRTRGAWIDVAEGERNQYTLAEIKRWLGVFLRRFFQSSQYKRSCVPNAPKVGSGGSLSPRGDWRAPSDGEAAAWLADLARVPDREA